MTTAFRRTTQNMAWFPGGVLKGYAASPMKVRRLAVHSHRLVTGHVLRELCEAFHIESDWAR